MMLTIKITPMNNDVEKYIIDKIKIQSRSINFFSKFNDKLCDNIATVVKKKFNYNISCSIINSIKSAYVKSKIIKNNFKLDENNKKIKNFYIDNEKLFNNKHNYKNPILFLSEKYTLSPLNIMRFIAKKKYLKKLGKIDKIEFSNFDKKMIDYSIKHDEYALIDGNKIMKDAIEFEKDIEKLLIKLGVKFKTQDQLSEEQIKKFGKAVNTPDFLILSDFYINDVKINWIDAKKFYGSCIKFVEEKINLKKKKYISDFGSGSIIFNLGFNKNLHYNNILLVDYESFYRAINHHNL